jgi:LPXTG-site transpeptidase (sortase) family protein
MSGRAFLFIFLALSALVVVTSPPVLGTLVETKVTPTPTPVPPTFTPTATATTDPFGHLPTATPLGRGGLAFSLPTPSLGELPPTFTSTPTATALGTLAITAPLPIDALWGTAELATESMAIPALPTPAGLPPDRLVIARLGLDAPIEPVGMVPSGVAAGVAEWGVPDHRAAGWLNTSAAFGLPGNTVLDGHHNVKGEVFRDLWTLQAGDEILLYAGNEARHYAVGNVLILPEKDQPLATRLANARYLSPTDDERLTLVTCWPYENNTHRTVVIAFPLTHPPSRTEVTNETP